MVLVKGRKKRYTNFILFFSSIFERGRRISSPARRRELGVSAGGRTHSGGRTLDGGCGTDLTQHGVCL